MTDQPTNPSGPNGPEDRPSGPAEPPAAPPASGPRWNAPAPTPPGPGWNISPTQGWNAPAAGTRWAQPGGPGANAAPGGFPPSAPVHGTQPAADSDSRGGYPAPGYPGPGHPAPGGYAPPPKPGVVPLRPLALGDLLDGSFQAIRRNAGATLGLSVLVQMLSGVVVALLSAPLYSVVMDPEVLQGADPDFDALTGSMLVFGGGTAVAGILTAVLLVLVQGTITIPVMRAVLNRKTRFSEAFALVRPSTGRLLGLGALWALAIVVVVVMLVGAILLAVAIGDPSIGVPLVLLFTVLVVATAVWVSIKLYFSAPALVAEDLGPFAAMARSWSLVRRSWWRCFGIVLLTGLIVGVATSIITTPFSFIGGLAGAVVDPADPESFLAYMMNMTLVLTVLSAAAAGLGYAYQCAVGSLLYTDLRIRREGLDLVLLREFEAGADTGIPGRTAHGGR